MLVGLFNFGLAVLNANISGLLRRIGAFRHGKFDNVIINLNPGMFHRIEILNENETFDVLALVKRTS